MIVRLEVKSMCHVFDNDGLLEFINLVVCIVMKTRNINFRLLIRLKFLIQLKPKIFLQQKEFAKLIIL